MIVKAEANIDRLRGTENAAAQHERNALRKEAPREEVPRDRVSVTRNVDAQQSDDVSKSLYSRRDLSDSSRGEIRASEPDAQNKLQLQINTPNSTRSGGSGGTLIVGDDAKVHINAQNSTSSGGSGGTLIIGDGAKVHINAQNSTSSGGGDAFIESVRASVSKSDSKPVTPVGGSTLAIGDGSNIQIETVSDARSLNSNSKISAETGESVSKSQNARGADRRSARAIEVLSEKASASTDRGESYDARFDLFRQLVESLRPERTLPLRGIKFESIENSTQRSTDVANLEIDVPRRDS